MRPAAPHLRRTAIIVVLLSAKEAIAMGRKQTKKGRQQLGLFQPKPQLPHWNHLSEKLKRDLKRLMGRMLREVLVADGTGHGGREVGDE
jgi:hypothetical protein